MMLDNEFLARKDKFILDENNNVVPANLMEWSEFIEKNKGTKVIKQEQIDTYFISTIFIGLDHSWYTGDPNNKPEDYEPHIFETIIFDESKEDGQHIYIDRYPTWKEAEYGHQKAIEWLKTYDPEKESE